MRRDYDKPTIAQVNLTPAEAVLSACKSEVFAGAGPGGFDGICRFDAENNCYGWAS